MPDSEVARPSSHKFILFAATLVLGAGFAYSASQPGGYDAFWGTVLIVLLCVGMAAFAKLAGPLAALMPPAALYALLVLMTRDFAYSAVLIAQIAPVAAVLSVSFMRKSMNIKNVILIVTAAFLLGTAGTVLYDTLKSHGGFTLEALLGTLDSYFTRTFAPYYDMTNTAGIMAEDTRLMMVEMLDSLRATYEAYLPAFYLATSLIKAYLGVFVTGFVLRQCGVYSIPTARVWRRHFSMSLVGAVVFAAAFVCMLLLSDPIYGMAASNLALVLSLPLALQGIAVLAHLFTANDRVRIFTLPALVIILLFFSLSTVLFLLAGVAVYDSFMDVRKLRPKKGGPDV